MSQHSKTTPKVIKQLHRTVNKTLKTQCFGDLWEQKLSSDTVLILKMRKSGSERELLN